MNLNNDQLMKFHTKARSVELEHWYHHDLFSFNWWLLLAVMLLAWGIWWKFIDKRRLQELLLFGSFTALSAAVLDEIGTSLSLWEYPDVLVPLETPLFIFDLVQVPVAYTLIYQYFPSWKSFLLWITLLAAFFAFAMEPLLVHLGIYHQIQWNYKYSFPAYIVLGCFMKWVVQRANHYQDGARQS